MTDETGKKIGEEIHENHSHPEIEEVTEEVKEQITDDLLAHKNKDMSHNHVEAQKPNYTLEDAQKHAAESAFEIKSGNAKWQAQCIDGRYEQKDSQACAIPGADGGQLEAMITAVKQLAGKKELDDAEITKLQEILIDLVGGVENLAFHTDDHAKHEHGIGCGYLKFGDKLAGEYGLTDKEIKSVLSFMNQNVDEKGEEKAKDKAINITLEGSHGERGVLNVDSPIYSVHNQTASKDQVFVFQKNMAEARNTELAKKIQESGLLTNDASEIAKKITEELMKQLTLTAGILAGGKGIFTVSFDENGKAIVTDSGKVAPVKTEEKDGKLVIVKETEIKPEAE